MTANRFAQISSIVFGIFALYSAAWAVPSALWVPRSLASNFLIFGFILTSMIFGLVLLFPHRFIPALRRLAQQSTLGPLKFLCALMMCVCLLVAKLTGAVNDWISYPIVAGFLVAFVFPGLAFRNLSIAPFEEIRLRDLGRLASEKICKESKFKRGLLLATLVFPFVSLAFTGFSTHMIPSPLWGALAGWIALLSGSLISILICRPLLQALPDSARRGSLPGLAFWGIVILAMSIFGCRAILLGAIPTGAAYIWGENAIQNAIVVKSSPDKSRKGCYGSVDILTAAGELELCNLSHDFLEELTRGDTVVITGRATGFGQTIESLRLLKN